MSIVNKLKNKEERTEHYFHESLLQYDSTEMKERGLCSVICDPFITNDYFLSQHVVLNNALGSYNSEYRLYA